MKRSIWNIEYGHKKTEKAVKRLKKIRIARDGYILLSIVFYIAGITYMVLPSVSPMVVCITSGVILVAYGIVKIIGYLSDDLYCLAFQYDLACGILLIVVGIIVLGCNVRIKHLLSPGLGLLILLDAVLKVQTSKDAKNFGLETWNWILAFSIIAGVFGVLIIIGPLPGVRASHILNGCGLLVEGIMNHLEIKETVKVLNSTVLPDINEDIFDE